MICKIDHTEPGAIPAPMCRVCRPELTPSPEVLAAAIAAERARNNAAQAESLRKRELYNAQGRLAAILKRGEPWESSVEGKIVKSLRRKIERLQQQETEQ